MKVLVVEDESHLLRLLQVKFERARHEVTTAVCGQDGLAALQSESVDLILIDQTLPDMQGCELAIILHQRPVCPGMLLLFPKGIQPEWVEGWIEPCNAYMTKPFNPEEVVRFGERIVAAMKML